MMCVIGESMRLNTASLCSSLAYVEPRTQKCSDNCRQKVSRGLFTCEFLVCLFPVAYDLGSSYQSGGIFPACSDVQSM